MTNTEWDDLYDRLLCRILAASDDDLALKPLRKEVDAASRVLRNAEAKPKEYNCLRQAKKKYEAALAALHKATTRYDARFDRLLARWRRESRRRDRREYMLAYHLAHPRKEYLAAWRLSHAKSLKIYLDRWKLANIEHVREYQREYYRRHK